MKQVVVIGGGDAYPTYDAYLSYLKGKKVENADYFKRGSDWKASLQDELGADYEVFNPQMPCKQNAHYEEWKIWFEKIIPFLKEGVILVGHSLGASFLAKYLSEERFPKKILAMFLVSGPYNGDNYRPVAEFVLPDSLARCERQCDKIFLYHSKDDSVVPFSELAKYHTALPKAKVTILKDRQHINQESFPELIADIRSI